MFTLLLCTFLQTGVLAATAAPAASIIQIDGQTVSFDAYLIGGNNYIKLRDLAYSLTGTKAQFEVSWNGSSVVLKSGTAYTPAGGEMSGKGTDIRSAAPSNAAIIKDGVKIPMSAYNIGGNNYFKIRDIAQIFDFSVEWSNGTVVIATGKPYVMPSSSSLAFNSYPLLLVGMTKAQIDAKLGTPIMIDNTGTQYPNGICLWFDVLNSGVTPIDANRCNYVAGSLSSIVSGCPASLTIAQIRSLFGSADIGYSIMDESNYLDINYGGSPLIIYCDGNGTVTPSSNFYFKASNTYSPPGVDYSWAIRTWNYSDVKKVSATEKIGDEVKINIGHASADKLVLDGYLYNYYGTSWVIASVEDVTLTSSDGKTYTASGVTDSWNNTLTVTVTLDGNRIIFCGDVTKLDNMARFAFVGDYILT